MRLPFSKRAGVVFVSLAVGFSFIGGIAHSQLSRRDTEALSQASLIYIATVRKSGNQSTAAPVWFTTSPNGDVLIQTAPTSWKAKRIRRGSQVMVWIRQRNGPAFIGKAQITSEPAVINRIVKDYIKKYWLARVGLHRPTEERFSSGEIVAIKITPIRDLPADFASALGTPAPKLSESARAE